MLTGATKYVETAWQVEVCPGLAIAIVVLAWNLLGDALRGVLDALLRDSS